jgi:hypothetical protein
LKIKHKLAAMQKNQASAWFFYDSYNAYLALSAESAFGCQHFLSLKLAKCDTLSDRKCK